MAYLRYGLRQGEGFIVITGGIGTGKTMLVSNLFNELEDEEMSSRRSWSRPRSMKTRCFV